MIVYADDSKILGYDEHGLKLMTVYPPIECPGCGRKCSHLRQASRTDLSMVCVSYCAPHDEPPKETP